MDRRLIFSNGKGVKLVGLLRNLSGKKSGQIIILCHGFSSHKNSSSYSDIADILEKHNISSFRFDFYGHGESSGKFENITITEATGDILQAIKYLKSKGYTKIGLIGGSFGGIASIMAASKTKDLSSLGLKSPVSNYTELYKEKLSGKEIKSWKIKGYKYYKSGDGRKLKLNYAFFEDTENNNGYKAAKRISIPTLIVHGNADEQVPYKQSVKISKIIRNCRLVTIKRANHHYDNPKNYKEMIKVLTDFAISVV